MPVEQLVSYKTRRILSIFAQSTMNDSLSVTEIQKTNHCSNKTAYDDINYIIDSWGHILEPTFEAGIFRLRNHGIRDHLYIKAQLLNEEATLQILITIIFNPNISLWELSEKTSYSESHIRNHIRNINGYLAVFHAKVDSTPNKHLRIISIKESELDLHYLFSQILSMTENIEMLPELPQDLTSKVNLFYQEINEVHCDTTKTLGDAVIRVTYMRSLQGFCDLDKTLAYGRDKIFRTLEQLNHELEKVDVSGLVGFLNQEMNVPDTKALESLTRKIISEAVLITCLFPFEIDSILNRFNVFYQLVGRTHRNIIRFYKEYLTAISELIKVDLHNNEGFIFFLLFTSIRELNYVLPFRIAVYSDLGLEHAANHVDFLRRHFLLHEVTIYKDGMSFDLLITTTLADFLDKIPVNKMVAVSDFITDVDYRNILRALYYKDDYL